MAEQSFDHCIRALATDVGRKRSANEDYLGERVTPNGLVTVVCDGMGGHVGGAVASHIAVDTILDYLTQNYFDNPDDAIVAAVSQANSAILQRAAEEPSLTGMGSTCVMIIVRDGLVHYGWVGDSRIYLIRQNAITQLSKDQSVVQALVDAGQLTPSEAEHHARKNEITNCLGIASMTPAVVGIRPISPQAGDSFLLCSDGLSGMVDDRSIAEIVSNRAGMRLQHRAEQLIAAANANGGLDNITALLLEFPSGMTPESGSDRRGMMPSRPQTNNIGVKPNPTRRNILLWGGVGLVSLLVTGAIVMAFLPDKDTKREGKGGKTDNAENASANAHIDAEPVKPFDNVTIPLNIAYAEQKISSADDENLKSVIGFVPVEEGKRWEVQDDAGKPLCTFTGSLTRDMIKVGEGFTVEPCRKGPDKGIFRIYPNEPVNPGDSLTVTIDRRNPAAENKKPEKDAKNVKEAESVNSPTITFKIQFTKPIGHTG